MKKLLLALVLALVVFANNPSQCQTEFSKRNNGLTHIPRDPALVVLKHLRKIEELGWAEVVPGDLMHLHIILSKESDEVKEFQSLEEVFSYAVIFLYHSDEQTRRWNLADGDLPIEKRRPRSIVGYPDGRIVSAASVMGTKLGSSATHHTNGSIRSDELAAIMPTKLAMRRWFDVPVPGKICYINLQIDISLGHGLEPVIELGNRRLKTTMDCMLH